MSNINFDEVAILLQEIEKKKAEQAKVKLIIGGGYDEFWNDKHRYRVLKGGRGSKKSTTTAIWFIQNIMDYPLANAVVVRKTANTHKDSTFAQLKWAATKLGVYDKWKFIEHPLEATYLPTGQKILFRGFDDPLKLTSITVDTGVLCWAWLEEAFEIEDEKDFDTFDESIRGEMPEGYWKQITITYNPWVFSHWTKVRFWDAKNPKDTFRLTTTHKCNEFLDQKDHDLIEELQYTNPARYRVVGLGEYGMPDGAYFEEFREDIHVINDDIEIPEYWDRYMSLDYGRDMLAALWYAIDEENNVYVYKEAYKSGLIVSEAAQLIKEINGNDKIRIRYAPPDLNKRNWDSSKSIFDMFRENGISLTQSNNTRVAGWMSVKEWIKIYKTRNIETGKEYYTSKLRILKKCHNLIRTLPSLQIDKINPSDCAKEPHEVTHAPDALRYFCIMRHRPTVKDVKKDEFLNRFHHESDSEELDDSYINMRVQGKY